MKNFKSFRTAMSVLGVIGATSCANTAFASTGCDALNNVGSVNPVLSGPYLIREDGSLTLEAGEIVTYSWSTLTNTTSRAVQFFVNSSYVGNAANGVNKNNPASVSYTVASDGTYDILARISATGGATASEFTVAVSCTPVSGGSSPETEEDTSQATTSKAVVNAVARSQTTVIQQNIGARVATVIGANGAGTVGKGGSSNLPGSTGSASGVAGSDYTSSYAANDSTRLQNDGWQALVDSDDDGTDDQRAVMRRIAMISSFDSSVWAANMEQALALGAGGVDGRAALPSTSPFTIWGHGSYTSVDNDYNTGIEDNRYDGEVWGYNLGADYRFENNLTAGVSIGYTDADLTTTFNDGSYQETAWVFSPYAIFNPITNLNIVVEAGYSQGDIDVTRDNDAVYGSTKSEMWYGSVKAIYAYRPMEDTPLTLSPSISALAARKTLDGYVESDGTFVDSTETNTRQLKPALEAAYDFSFDSLIVTPFVETSLVYDFTDAINNDKTAFNIGGGVRLAGVGTGFNAALEGSYLAGHTDYTEYTVAGTVSYGFELHDDDGQSVGLVTPFLGGDIDEYGNQLMKGGVGFNRGQLASRVALAQGVTESGNSNSQMQFNMSLKF